MLHPLLTVDGLLSGSVRAIRAGRDIPLEMVTLLERDTRRRVLVPDRLQELCGAGLSLTVEAVAERVPAVGALAAMLERQLDARVTANCYLSFGRGGAFQAHWDGHDVIVLQLHGRKRWWCHGDGLSEDARPEPFPVRGHILPDRGQAGPADWEGVLEPGDVLFLPRGMVHVAEVAGPHSVHLTLGVSPPRGTDALSWLAAQAAGEELFRMDIPAGAGDAALARHEEELRQAVRRLADRLDLRRFLADEGRSRAPLRPVNLGMADPADPRAWVQPALRRAVPLPAAGPADIRAGRVRARLTGPEARVLASLLDAGGMRAGDLAAAVPGMDAEEVRAALSGLAAKSLAFLLEGGPPGGGPGSVTPGGTSS